MNVPSIDLTVGFHSVVDLNYIEGRHFPYCKIWEIVQSHFLTHSHTILFKLVSNELKHYKFKVNFILI